MRDAIRREIESIEPLDELERQQIRDALTWIDSGVELCRIQKPAIPPKHLVSYFALVDEQHVLLVDHKNAQLWLPNGGHVDAGEHPRTTVARELSEELGLELDGAPAPPLMLTTSVTVGVTAGHTDVSLWYVIDADRTLALRFDDQEFHGVRWFEFSEAPLSQSDPHLGRFLEKLSSSNHQKLPCEARSMNQEPNEIIRADPVYRKRALLILAGLTVLLVVVSLAFGDAIEAWLDRNLSLAASDAAAGENLLARTTWAVMIFVWLLGASALIVATWYGRKLWTAEQWPPVGARLLHDTPVIRGRQLRIFALVLFSLGIVVFAAALYTTWTFSVLLSPAR